MNGKRCESVRKIELPYAYIDREKSLKKGDK